MSAVTREEARPRREGRHAAGLGTLLRFALKRDRIALPAWILGITLAVVGTAASYPALYPTAEERLGARLTIDNPGTTALIGAIYGGDDYTYGIMTGHALLALIAVCAALMSIFTLVRHTRAEEESGRAELVRSSVTGRHSHALAAAILVLGANVVLALALTAGLGALGVETITWGGSLLFGSTIAAAGFVFAGVAAVTSQLAASARAASGSAGLVLALAYVLRAIGDVSNETLSWLSPIGWSQATQVYYADNWAPLGISLAATAALFAVAAPLNRRRDLGAGLLSTRPGPARGGAALAGPLGLAWRLSRTVVLVWSIGLLAFGLMYGPVLSEASSFLDDMPIIAEFLPDLEASGAELFGATVIAVAAILCSVPAVQIALRLRSEETAGRVGPMLATPLPRVRWMGASLLLAMAVAAVMLAVMGLGIGIGAGLSMDDASWIATSVTAAIAYLPASAVTVGLAALLLGWAPRAAGWSWALVAFAAVVLYFGGILDLPQWLIDVSPFSHVPQQPAESFDAAPLAWLAVIAVALTAAGLIGIRRRDITEG